MVPASMFVLSLLGAVYCQDNTSIPTNTDPVTSTTSSPGQGMNPGTPNNTTDDDDLIDYFGDSDERDTTSPSSSGDVLMDSCTKIVQQYASYSISNVTYNQDECQLNCFGGYNAGFQGYGDEDVINVYYKYQMITSVNDMMSCSEDKKKNDMVCFKGSCVKTDPDSFDGCTKFMNKKSIALQGRNECKIKCVYKGNITTQYNGMTTGLVETDFSLPDGLPCAGTNGMCEQGNCLSKTIFPEKQHCM